MNPTKKPAPTSSLAEKELDRVDEQFKQFDQEVQQLTLDSMNASPTLEKEMQTKLATSEIDKDNSLYIKPHLSIGSREKFNERFKSDYLYSKEYVNIIAENREILGEQLEFWTKPYPGMPAEFWKIPVNKPIWTPRYVAEQIKRCSYHILVMEQKPIGNYTEGQYFGTLAASHTVNRLDALPVTTKRNVFMGVSNF